MITKSPVGHHRLISRKTEGEILDEMSDIRLFHLEESQNAEEGVEVSESNGIRRRLKLKHDQQP